MESPFDSYLSYSSLLCSLAALSRASNVALVFNAQTDQCSCKTEMLELYPSGQMTVRSAIAFWAVCMFLPCHPYMMDLGYSSILIPDDLNFMSGRLTLWQMKDTSAIVRLGASPDVSVVTSS